MLLSEDEDPKRSVAARKHAAASQRRTLPLDGNRNIFLPKNYIEIYFDNKSSETLSQASLFSVKMPITPQKKKGRYCNRSSSVMATEEITSWGCKGGFVPPVVSPSYIGKKEGTHTNTNKRKHEICDSVEHIALLAKRGQISFPHPTTTKIALILAMHKGKSSREEYSQGLQKFRTFLPPFFFRLRSSLQNRPFFKSVEKRERDHRDNRNSNFSTSRAQFF